MKTAAELKEYNEKRFIDQICYVTDDYQRTIEYFTNALDMGPWTIIENTEDCAFYEVGNSAVCSSHPRLVGYYPEH